MTPEQDRARVEVLIGDLRWWADRQTVNDAWHKGLQRLLREASDELAGLLLVCASEDRQKSTPVKPRVAEIQQRVDAATKGPWRVDEQWVMASVFTSIAQFFDSRAEGSGNAEFIAHARADVPYLLARLAEKETENARLALVEERLKRADFHGMQVPPRGPYVLIRDVFPEMAALLHDSERTR